MTTTTTTTSPLREIHDPTTGFTALVHVPPANPSGETEEVALPLLVYLHGAGESGNNVRDLISEGATGTPVVELEYKRALPILSSRFVMVAPQTNHGWRPEKVHQFLDFLLSGQQQHGLPNMDETRCYVTGHSMGGAGALYAAATRTRRRFAAVVPVAPSGSATHSADLKGVPVWAFHGTNDIVCPSTISERLIKDLWDLGVSSEDAKLSLIEDCPAPLGWPRYSGHGTPRVVYNRTELWDWLLEQHL